MQEGTQKNENSKVQSGGALDRIKRLVNYPENPEEMVQKPTWGYFPGYPPEEMVSRREAWWVVVKHDLAIRLSSFGLALMIVVTVILFILG